MVQWNLDLRKPDLRKNLDLRKIVGATDFLVHTLFDLRKIFLGPSVGFKKDSFPNSGKNISGRSAVINKGIASVAQRIAIKDPTAATRHALIEIPSGWGLRSINRKIVIAKQSLILILFIRFITKFIS